MLKKISFEIIVFILFFIIVTIYLIKSHFLFFDDIIYAFPAYSHNYLSLWKGYFNQFGFFRPLALIYYFFIYEIFLRAPWLTRLIPLAVLYYSAILLYKILTLQGLNKKFSFAAGILLVSIPFVTEAYSWLSANIGLIVLLILFIQIYTIEKIQIKKNLLNVLFWLQIISVYLYETTIFMPFALSYLLWKRDKEKDLKKLAVFSSVPMIIYVLTKKLGKPQFMEKARFLNFNEMIGHWQTFLPDLRILFSSDYLSKFWSLEFIEGLKYAFANPFVVILIVLSLLLISYRLFEQTELEKLIDQNTKKTNLIFWVFVFILSLVPLSWHDLYIPFRLMVLPVLSFIIVIFFVIELMATYPLALKINNLFRPFFTGVFIILIFIFISIQISMINQYYKQYVFDKKIALDIDRKLESYGFDHPYRSNLYLKNFPNNNIGRLLYGEYIYGLIRNYWSAQAFLDLNSGSVDKVAVDISPTEYSAKYFSSKIPRDEFINMRPLTILKFTDFESCIKKECFIVEEVLR